MLKKSHTAAIVAVLLAACGPSADEIRAKETALTIQRAAEAESTAKYVAKQEGLKPKRTAFLAALKHEPQIKDAAWLNEETNSVLVGVLNDGTRWYGYAQYVCGVMTDHQLYDGIVRIMDAAAATREEWREMEKVNCQTEQQATAPIEFVEFPIPKPNPTK